MSCPSLKKSSIYENIDAGSPLKYQWLEFLNECSKQEDEPNRDEIIKKGYEIMKLATWNPDTQTLYWKQKENALATEKATEEAFEQGVEKGKLEGVIKTFKNLVKMGISISHEQTQELFKDLLGDEQVTFLETYIPTHIEASIDDLMSKIGGGDSNMYEID